MVEFSVIILTFNSERTIKKLLANLLASTQNSSIEIIIFDSGSTDNTIFIVQSFIKNYKNIHFFKIKQKKFSFAETRNVAILKARGKYILYISSDCYLPVQPKLFNRVRDVFLSEKSVVAVFGKQIPFKTHMPYYRLELISLFQNLDELISIKNNNKASQSKNDLYLYKMHKKEFLLYFLSNVFVFYKKSFLLKNKFYLLNGINTGEDFIMGKTIIDVGYKKVYLNSIYVVHSHNFSLFEYFKRERDNLILCKLFDIIRPINLIKIIRSFQAFNFLDIALIILSIPLFYTIKFLSYVNVIIEIKKIKNRNYALLNKSKSAR